MPLAQLEDTLVPLYLFHRYQTEAATKEIGGLDYRYNLRGDGQIFQKSFRPPTRKTPSTPSSRPSLPKPSPCPNRS